MTIHISWHGLFYFYQWTAMILFPLQMLYISELKREY